MDRISCDIICDLLPLYCDDVISQDGRALVEEHLGSCPACADMLERMKTECRVPGDKERAREAVVKGMASEWGRSVKKSFAQGALLAFLMCLLLAGARCALTRFVLVNVPGGQLAASVGRVTDERVELSVTAENGKRVSRTDVRITADGRCYLIVKQALLAEKNGEGERWTGDFSLARSGVTQAGDTVRITEIYCGDEAGGVLVWREE